MAKEKEGLCGWLAKKHKWSKEKKEKCIRKAKHGKRGRKKSKSLNDMWTGPTGGDKIAGTAG